MKRRSARHWLGRLAFGASLAAGGAVAAYLLAPARRRTTPRAALPPAPAWLVGRPRRNSEALAEPPGPERSDPVDIAEAAQGQAPGTPANLAFPRLKR